MNTIRPLNIDVRLCACGCGNVLTQRANERPVRFKERVMYSRACAGRLKRLQSLGDYPKKSCACGCGAVLEPRPGESSYRFHQRKTHSWACHGRLRSSQWKQRAQKSTQLYIVRYCACGCGAALEPRPKERVSEFKVRVAHTRACFGRIRRQKALQVMQAGPVKLCACGCGEVLTPRPKENFGQFSARVAHSRACVARLQKGKKKRSQKRISKTGMTLEEISDELGLAITTVHSIEKRALAKLRAWAEQMDL